MAEYRLEDLAIVMNPDFDHVAVAKTNILAGTLIEYEGKSLTIRKLTKKGHRFTLTDIKKGEFISQYGYPFAKSKGILRGDLISISNIINEIPETDLKSYKKPPKTKLIQRYLEKSFLVYVRKPVPLFC